ncbi:TPA: hypothetical protein ACHWP6_001713, partial [Legionella pneumophila]
GCVDIILHLMRGHTLDCLIQIQQIHYLPRNLLKKFHYLKPSISDILSILDTLFLNDRFSVPQLIRSIHKANTGYIG